MFNKAIKLLNLKLQTFN